MSSSVASPHLCSTYSSEIRPSLYRWNWVWSSSKVSSRGARAVLKPCTGAGTENGLRVWVFVHFRAKAATRVQGSELLTGRLRLTWRFIRGLRFRVTVEGLRRWMYLLQTGFTSLKSVKFTNSATPTAVSLLQQYYRCLTPLQLNGLSKYGYT